MDHELLAEFITENLNIYEKSDTSYMLNNLVIGKKILFTKISNDTWRDTPFQDIAFMDDDSKKALSEKLAEHLNLPNAKQRKYQEGINKFKEILNSTDLIGIKFEDIEKYQHVVDMESDDDFLFDTQSQCLATGFNYKTWARLVPKEVKNSIVPIPVLMEYCPYEMFKARPGKYISEDGATPLKVTVVNKHRFPAWRYMEDDGEGLPPIIQEFLEHLFPVEESRKFVYNWVRMAITQRCGTYLVLNAAKGIGKNIFTDMLKHLVGADNYNKAHRKFFSSGFNKLLEDKRIILIDEHSINNEERIDMLKDYINPEQNIEAKGIDADKAIETFNSFVICNNRATDIKIEQDDRRFSVIETTAIKLNKIWSEEKILELINCFSDETTINRIGKFFLAEDYSHKWGTEDAWKGERFRYLVKVSLWEWQKFIVDTITKKEEDFYIFEVLRRQYGIHASKNSSLGKDRVIDFLMNYETQEGQKLGSWGTEDGEEGIIPSNFFRKTKKTELDDL